MAAHLVARAKSPFAVCMFSRGEGFPQFEDPPGSSSPDVTLATTLPWWPELAPGARQIFTPDGYPNLIQRGQLPRLLHSWNTCSLTSPSWGLGIQTQKKSQTGFPGLGEGQGLLDTGQGCLRSPLGHSPTRGSSACSWRAVSAGACWGTGQHSTAGPAWGAPGWGVRQGLCWCHARAVVQSSCHQA